MGNLISQCIFIKEPSLTEKNLPDQTGKVHLVTGGYTGVGYALVSILYSHNAHVYIAGRNQSKADSALASLRQAHPASKGQLSFLSIDLSDLHSVGAAARDFLAREKRLDTLTNNAGVMFPPRGTVGAQGVEMQIATNCTGSFLLSKLLMSRMEETAAMPGVGRDEVRCTWPGSIGVDVLSPRGGGMTLENDGRPKVLGPKPDYGQSKVGNLFLAKEFARRGKGSTKVVHACFNPGNLKTELQRHSPSIQAAIVNLGTYPAIFGAYTELYSAFSPDLTMERSGSYIVPWGQFSSFRSDILQATKTKEEGGTGKAADFFDWCDKFTAEFA